MPHDDLEIEPVRGLPEIPPEGESILWQGAPLAWPLAKQALNAHWVAAYFGALALWRGVVTAGEDGVREGLIAAFWYVLIGAVAVGVLFVIAWIMARATVYTITTHRVAMRIGAALTVTLNLPFRWIGSADLAMHRDGTGTITLDLTGETRLSYPVVWPHVKPWSIGRTVPALRCIPEPEKVARLLADAAATRVSRLDAGTGAFAAGHVAAE
jgi:hypothetical protein